MESSDNRIFDFHAHILPGTDHGCLDSQEALTQISAAKDAGVATVIATPHFYPQNDNVETFLARRAAAWETLSAVLPSDSPHILLGAEVNLCVGMEHMEGLSSLQCGRVLLLEMPLQKWSHSLIDTLESIDLCADRQVVLAHVDRYPPKDVDRLLSAGYRGQLNAQSVCRVAHRPLYRRWIRSGYIVALGSDTHNTGETYHAFSKALSLLRSDGDTIMQASKELLSDQRQTHTLT